MKVTIRDARFVAAAVGPSQLPAPMVVEIAFAGRSNVGKSSLLNALLQRNKLARTSSTPGCTRTINLFRVELAEPQATIDFIDLPGYGFAKRSKAERRGWGQSIEALLRHRAGLRSIVIIVDARRGFEGDDLDLVAFARSIKLDPLLVATKLDKLPSSKQTLRIRELSKETGERVHGFSAESGLGRDMLWSSMLRSTAVGGGSTGGA